VYPDTLLYVNSVAGVHTFVFSDLVGFTALAATEGDDRAATVAVDFFATVRSMLGDHGAEQIKTLGDGVMLRCDAPGRAIALGLRIVDELGAVEGFPPVRVGMHTGPAVVREGDWFGTTVNVAARLCAAAGGGQVLVSEETWKAAAAQLDDIEADERRLHWLKNVREPIAARLAARRRPSRFLAGRSDARPSLLAMWSPRELGA
jgi:adenylate cyclase